MASANRPDMILVSLGLCAITTTNFTIPMMHCPHSNHHAVSTRRPQNAPVGANRLNLGSSGEPMICYSNNI